MSFGRRAATFRIALRYCALEARSRGGARTRGAVPDPPSEAFQKSRDEQARVMHCSRSGVSGVAERRGDAPWERRIRDMNRVDGAGARGRDHAAADDGCAIAHRIEQAGVQPELVLIRRIERRPFVYFEPTDYGSGQRLDFNIAIEPRPGEQKSHRFEAAEARRMQRAPLGPELGIAMSVEEIGELPYVERLDVSAQEMPREVQCGVAELIDERELVAFAALPEFFDAFGGKTFRILIPEAKMHFDRGR